MGVGQARRVRTALGAVLLAGSFVGPLLVASPAGAATITTLFVVKGATGTTCTSKTSTQACPTLADALGQLSNYAGHQVDVTVGPGTFDEHTLAVTATGLSSLVVHGKGALVTTVTGGGAGTVWKVTGGSVRLTTLSITGGQGSYGGGLVDQGTATVVLLNDSVSTDQSTSGLGQGGGVFVGSNATLIARNTTFAHDTATYGGAVNVQTTAGKSGTAAFSNATFFEDHAAKTGGAIVSRGTVSLLGVTLATDTAASGGGISDSGPSSIVGAIFRNATCAGSTLSHATGGHNVTATLSCQPGTGDWSTGTATRLGLATVLTPSTSVTSPNVPETLALSSFSPAIDFVPATRCTAPLNFDERGLPRPGISGQSACDAGAYELQGTGRSPTITSASKVTFTAGTAQTFTITVTGFPGARTTLTGTTPKGVNVVYQTDGSAALSGTASSATVGTYVVKVYATNTVGSGATQTLVVTVAPPPPPPTAGYWEVAGDGGIFSFGTAAYHGSMGGKALNEPIVGMAKDAATGGYWEVASDGGIFAFTAPFYGSMGGKPLNQPIVGMAATPTGKGYYEVASDGGIFAFGSAGFHGSMGGKALNEPIVGMTTDTATGGYWEVASDGGIFAFTAPFYGSMGGKPLNQPIVGMAATPTGKGYYEVASDGGIFAFGSAAFHGSMGGKALNAPIVGLAVTAATGGYWEVASDGGIFAFTAPFEGSMGGKPLNEPIVGMATA